MCSKLTARYRRCPKLKSKRGKLLSAQMHTHLRFSLRCFFDFATGSSGSPDISQRCVLGAPTRLQLLFTGCHVHFEHSTIVEKQGSSSFKHCGQLPAETRTAHNMDNVPEGVSYEETISLSYDDSVPYEEQLLSQHQPADEPVQPALLNRIGTNKVYLIADSVQTRTAKVR